MWHPLEGDRQAGTGPAGPHVPGTSKPSEGGYLLAPQISVLPGLRIKARLPHFHNVLIMLKLVHAEEDLRLRHREEHVKMEAESAVMSPPAKERLGPPEAGIGEQGLSPRASSGGTACGHLGFRLPASEPKRERTLWLHT